MQEPTESFQEFVVALLHTYLDNPPEFASTIAAQIAAIKRFDSDINGYGAFCTLTIEESAPRLPRSLCVGYLPGPQILVRMKGQEVGLQFALIAEDGYIKSLEIFPCDGIGWDGVVREYDFEVLDFSRSSSGN